MEICKSEPNEIKIVSQIQKMRSMEEFVYALIYQQTFGGYTSYDES